MNCYFCSSTNHLESVHLHYFSISSPNISINTLIFRTMSAKSRVRSNSVNKSLRLTSQIVTRSRSKSDSSAKNAHERAIPDTNQWSRAAYDATTASASRKKFPSALNRTQSLPLIKSKPGGYSNSKGQISLYVCCQCGCGPAVLEIAPQCTYCGHETTHYCCEWNEA